MMPDARAPSVYTVPISGNVSFRNTELREGVTFVISGDLGTLGPANLIVNLLTK